MLRHSLLVAFGLVAASLGASQSQAQIIGGHGGPAVLHSTAPYTFSGGYPGSPVYAYQEPLAARPVAAPGFTGYLHEPVLSARNVTSAGAWPEGAYNTPAPINYATIGPNQPQLYGANSFWLYDPSQGSPIWNRYNRGRY